MSSEATARIKALLSFFICHSLRRRKGWAKNKALYIQQMVLKTANKPRFVISLKSIRILYVGVKYSMCDLICDVISYCALRCDI